MKKPRKSFQLLFAVASIGISLLACSLESVTGPSGTPQTSNLLFFDDFSNPDSGWETNTQEGVKEYFQGTYHINIQPPNYFSWSTAQQSFGDVRVKVELAYTGSANMAEMGVICRMQDAQNFYFFMIRSDGNYAVLRMEDGIEHFLGMSGYQPNPAIKTGVTTNSVETRCIGDQLSLYVNEQEMIAVNDSNYQVGDVGVIAGTFDQGNADIYFDNFEVNRP